MRLKKSILISFLALAFTGCASQVSQSPVGDVSNVPGYPSVKVLSWSDFHSSIYEAKKSDGSALGGLPVFMAAVETLRGDGLSLLLDGGDMFQGAMPFNEAKGLGMIEVMNALKIDAATIGNHEFDYGPGAAYPDNPRGAMYEAFERSNFPWVNANVVATADNPEPWPPKNLKPYVVLNKGPYRIAIVGVLATETPIATIASNVAGLEFKNPAATLQAVIPEVMSQKPDFVIVEAHVTGLPQPEPERDAHLNDVPFDGEVAEILNLPPEILGNIDLLLTSHSHSSFIAFQGELTVIQSLSAGREITELTLVGDGKGLHIDRESVKKHYLKHEQIDARCGETPRPLHEIGVGDLVLLPSQDARDIIAKYESRMTENRCDVLGCFDEDVTRTYDGECALGNLTTDALRAHFDGAQAAIQNPGGLRIDMPKGNIYRENLNALMPFENFAYLVAMPGADILRVLKVGATLKHGAMQVSGLQYRFEPGCHNPEDLNGDGKIESWENNCLCEGVRINGEPLDSGRTYRVATSDFMYKGGDSLGGCFGASQILQEGPLVKKTIFDYVSKAKACFSKSSLISESDPRITRGSCQGKFAH